MHLHNIIVFKLCYSHDCYTESIVDEHLVKVTEPAKFRDDKELLQIQKEITCLICGNFFTDPTTLSCSHTFCKRCIMNSLQQNKLRNIACCPLCCEILSEEDVESIPINFNAQKLVEAFKKDKESKKCGNCEKEDTLVVWCIECNNLYCQNCNEIHKNWKDFKQHRVVQVKSPSEKCNIHFKPLDFYCRTCCDAICQECTLKLHPFKKHDIDLIDTVVHKTRENIKGAVTSLNQLLQHLRSETKSIEDYEDLVDKESEICTKEIKTLFRKRHELLTKNEENLLQNLDSNKASLKQMLTMQKRNVAILEIQLEGCKRFTENVMVANRTQQILTYDHWIMRRVNQLTAQVGNVNFDLQSRKHTSSGKLDEFSAPLCFMESLLHLPHCSIHVCTPVVKPKQVKLIVTLKDILGYPMTYQSRNITIHCNVEGDFLQNVQVNEQPDLFGVYHIDYSVKQKIKHLIFVYWGNILVNHDNIEVSVTNRDYASMNKQEGKVIKDGLPETPLKFPYSLVKGPHNLLIFGDDSSSQLVVFNDQMQYLHCIGRRGKEEGEFQNITGVTVDGNKDIYVADSDLNCIQKFELKGKFIYKFGEYGSNNNQFKSPHGLLVSHSKLFVCDRHNHRIQVFIMEEWCYTIGQHGTEPGNFNEPINLSLSNSKDQLFVTDSKNHRVQVFTIDGQFLKVFGNLKDIPSALQKIHWAYLLHQMGMC